MELDDDDMGYSDLRGKVGDTQNNSWLTSYADIITILLAFFMIFYAFEKSQSDRPTIAQEAMIKLQEKFFVMEKTEDKPIQESISAKELKEKNNELEGAFGGGVFNTLQKVNKEEGITVFNHSYYINIVFNKGSFFNKGSYKLNNSGRRQIEKLSVKLKPYAKDLKINIIGHTDSTPVHKKNTSWWKSNMELSVLRSLNVYQYFIKKGLSKDSLYVSGMADINTNQMFDEAEEKVSLDGKIYKTQKLSQQRKITIRVEPK